MTRRKRTALSVGLAAVATSLLGGCASLPPRQDLVINDPYEASNREALKINEAVVGPLSRGYRVIPAPIRERISTFHANTQEPRIFVNDVLQGRFPAAGRTAARFVINSTVGIAGLIDVAGTRGLPQETGDFGQTLYVYGVQGDVYFVSPALGPTTSRDSLGFLVDTAADPVGLTLTFAAPGYATYAYAGISLADDLDKYQSAQSSSLDFYTFLRSSYIQTRRSQLREAIGLPKEATGPASFPTLDKPKRKVKLRR